MGAQRQTMVKKVSKASAPKVEFPKNAIEKKPRKFSVGGDVLPPKRDLTRFVKWPKYIRLQRAKMTLLKRIKIPPAINQFAQTFDKRQASQLFRLLNNLKPETKTEKRECLKGAAETAAAGGRNAAKKPVCMKMGINHVTSLVEEKKAKLVVIAHDVDPIEVVCWLPSLCKARGIPYCIVKSKARLATLVTLAEANFNNVYDDAMRKWGDAEASGRQQAAAAKRGN